MKINITKKEYRLLLDVLSISDWVMGAHDEEPDPRIEPYKQLEQKFLAFAKDFGYEDLVEYEKKFEKYFPTKKYEDAGTDHIFIDEYDDNVFWQELCTRLAQRDMLEEFGEEQLSKMDIFERIGLEDEKSFQYNNDFAENGLKNLVILKKNSVFH